ncbi:hypothetical protein D3878_19720 [Noviherbaspirillum sedimenti]|uniref:Uncharacterized protein n=2 Tax=Noviherbaspirillum sedimenti TaxID=2320865 RepID=A0A3A3G7Q8_9BURK|nr:hypothetical protein D3878_19720 [Noviherbaspirillum sedimenti]
MYIPKLFEETRVDIMHELIRAQPLATLVTLGPDGLNANHIPLHIASDTGAHGVIEGLLATGAPEGMEMAQLMKENPPA